MKHKLRESVLVGMSDESRVVGGIREVWNSASLMPAAAQDFGSPPKVLFWCHNEVPSLERENHWYRRPSSGTLHGAQLKNTMGRSGEWLIVRKQAHLNIRDGFARETTNATCRPSRIFSVRMGQRQRATQSRQLDDLTDVFVRQNSNETVYELRGDSSDWQVPQTIQKQTTHFLGI